MQLAMRTMLRYTVLFSPLLFVPFISFGVEFREEKECRHGDAYACLRQAIRHKDSRSKKYTDRVFEIWKTEKPRKQITDNIVSVAIAITAGNSTKSNALLEAPCEAHKIPEACFALILREEKGQKRLKHTQIIEQNCDQNNSNSCYFLAQVEFFNDETAKAAVHFARACDLGSYDACLVLGDDLATKEKYTEAVLSYQKACDAKFPGSCAKIAFVYKKQNITDKAKKLLINQCDDGDGDACGYYVELFEIHGSAESERLYKKGCSYGNNIACINLGSLYREQTKYSEARGQFSLACNNDSEKSAYACLELGNLCNSLTDESCSSKAFAKGCESGSGKSCMGMALLEINTLKKKTLISNQAFSKAKNYLLKAKGLLSTECSEGNNDSCKAMPQLTSILEKLNL